jgi:hypothetical protein
MTSQAIGLSTINGLPAHVLIVHLVVVFVPLSAIFLVASLHPRGIRRLGSALPITAAIALLSVFAAMNAGGWLQNHVDNTALVRRHTQLGGQLWPFSAAVLLFSLIVWWRARTQQDQGARTTGRDSGAVAITAAIAVLSIAASVLSLVWVYRIGDSGARAAWHDRFSTTTGQHY